MKYLFCIKCNKLKSIEEFKKDKTRKSGYHPYCKECTYFYIKKRRLEHPEDFLKKHRIRALRYYYRHREEIRKRTKESNKKRCREYYQRHKIEILMKIREKLRTDIKFRLDHNMGTSIRLALKHKKAGRKWEKLVGYTLEDLMKHLEKQFDNKMTWNNYGSYWEIDHIIPKSYFKYINPEDEDFKKCWALENLQPLERSLNRSKRNKLLQ
jgi:hypothetical protein